MCCRFPNKARIGFKTWRLRNWRTENYNYNTQACNDNFLCLSFSQVKWKITVKNFVFVNENQFTWRSSQNYTLSYYHLTFSQSNRLIVLETRPDLKQGGKWIRQPRSWASGKVENRNLESGIRNRNGNRKRDRKRNRKRNRNGKRNQFKNRDNVYVNLS